MKVNNDGPVGCCPLPAVLFNVPAARYHQAPDVDAIEPGDTIGARRMQTLNVLGICRTSAQDRAKISNIDPAVCFIDAGGWFDGEVRDTWPEYAAQRYLPRNAQGAATRTERDRLLAEADVILGGWPFPLDLRARARQLQWFHQRTAGASNLRLGDLWASDIVVTTSRGAGATRAIAEYALAAIMHFAKGFNCAAIDRQSGAFNHAAYRPLLLEGKTVCVIGVGGIGRQVGELCAALGLNVVGTRRDLDPSAPLPAGFTALAGPSDLDRLLADSDFVVIACQWTPETTGLIDAGRLAAMKPGAVLVNVARGEIVDEDALLDAVRREHLRGAALDVYVGEFEHAPPPRLWSDPRVLLTPHVSGAGDVVRSAAIDLFCENLRAFIDGRPLANVIDWARGY